jgi:Predicted membrane protein, hemolysin III homolog
MSTIAETVSASTSRRQSPGEELANALSHGLGALSALVAFPFLVAAAASEGRRAWPYAIFDLSLALLFAASAVYHSVSDPGLKRRLRVLDHSSIYFLIAGTYSAYSLDFLGGAAGWGLFAAEWAIAALGLWLSATRMDKLKAAGPIIYIAMGWLIAPFLGKVRTTLGPDAFFLLAAGGVAYTVGVIFYALKRVPYCHVIWHFFVLAGAACHVASLLIVH